MNCIYNDCSHLYARGDDLYCSLTGTSVPDDIEKTQCNRYSQAKTCIDCIHAKVTVYETGEVDSIEYRCSLQEGAFIYEDTNPYCSHYSDVPECNIGKFEYGRLNCEFVKQQY